MLVLQGPRIWAILLIFLGFVFAYPFLKRDHNDSAIDSLDGSPPQAQHRIYASSEAPVTSSASNQAMDARGVFDRTVFDGTGAPAPLPSTNGNASKLASAKPKLKGSSNVKVVENGASYLACSLLQSESAKSAVAERERLRDIPSEQLGEEPLPDQSQFTYDRIKSLPSWAQRQSRMDALVNLGVESQASEPIRQPLKEMTAWTNTRMHPQGSTAKDSSSSNEDELGPKRQIREIFALRSSPFGGEEFEDQEDESQDWHLDRKLPHRTVDRSWDVALSKLDPKLLAQSTPQNVSSQNGKLQTEIPTDSGLPSRERIASTDSTGIKKIGATLRATSRTSIRPIKRPGNLVVGASLSSTPAPPSYHAGTREKQMEDRKRHFVYQPGHPC